MPEEQKSPFPVEEFLRAVRAEIEAVLVDDGVGGEKLALHGGQRVGGTTDDFEYLFACKKWKESFSGKRLLIRLSRSRDRWVPAQASRMPDGKILVATTADLGAEPKNAQLREDDTAGLEALAERLEQAGDPGGPLNLNTAGWLVGRGRPRTARSSRPGQIIPGYGGLRLNERQREAIEQALASEITFIWGPPGTGKTDVVTHIVEGCHRQGERVLFLAPTKVAVDQALERMCERLSGEDGFDSGLVQRAGDIEIASLAEKYGEQISPARLAARLTAELTTQITDATERLDTVRAGLELHDAARRTEEERQTLITQRVEADQAITAAERLASMAEEKAADVEHQMIAVGQPTGLRAQRKADKIDRLRSELHGHRNASIAHRRQMNDALIERGRCVTAIEEAESRLAQLKIQLYGVDGADRLQDEAAKLRERLTRLEEERQKITEGVRKRCQVMGATIAKAIQSRQLMETVDVVVIDEAGMVDLPSAWCAAGMARKRVVVAGDFRQLPAVTHGSSRRDVKPEDRDHSRTWMDRDAFHAAGLVDVEGTVRTDPRMVSLNRQYRMRPAICEVVNTVAYPDAPLSTGRNDYSRLPASPLIEGPLVLIDSTPRRIPNGDRRSGHKSNPVHEAVIHELIRGLQYDAVLPARKWSDLPEGERPTDRMAVIAPFRDQVNALKTSLKYRFGQDCEGLVDTVHRFQGSQRPLVVIDTVAGAGDKLGYFYEGIGLSSTTCRLLNVALSRAQDHLVVVADVDFLHHNLEPGSEAARMLGYLERHAQSLPVDDLVPFRSAADLAGLDEKELARPAFFPADEVQRAVEWDIGQARRSIEIHCAFLDPVPVRRWLRHLAERISDGVDVTVHTRNHEAGTTGAHLMEDLRAAGCTVSVRERMHEKVLIIDDTVLWHGSLNLLANTGPTDLMMRITDPGACERVRRIVERARMERPARTPPPWRRTPAAGTDAASAADGVSAGDVLNGRLYLNVPFDEKGDAKRLVKARWDATRRLWHVAAETPRAHVQRWLPPGR
ncbi:AAA domain-containing protein [Actinoallomurus rhizosphaericola]|uniref:AAA domain-containing protein n=1 Tax=Actinoallomurus rhizosphaericola TaxID=2952536 RepID=UPI00209194A5|nr:AAA domain-containing protein [Actinoallomurus rhizosphaericola]MCO5994773.1 AAA family ATPase [Actinoallomurus rhizosphaericola]